MLDLIEMEISDLLSKHWFEVFPITRWSAVDVINENSSEYWEESIKNLFSIIENNVWHIERDLDKPFLMWIEAVFNVKGRWVAVTGKWARWVIKMGEEVEIIGYWKTTKTIVTWIEQFKRPLQEWKAGDNLWILLRWIKFEDVQRWQVVTIPGKVKNESSFEAEIYVLPHNEWGRKNPLFSGQDYIFLFDTWFSSGKIKLLSSDMILGWDNGTVSVELIKGMGIYQGQRFAIMEWTKTVGSGIITKLTN
jgi:elongation factor Tu